MQAAMAPALQAAMANPAAMAAAFAGNPVMLQAMQAMAAAQGAATFGGMPATGFQSLQAPFAGFPGATVAPVPVAAPTQTPAPATQAISHGIPATKPKSEPEPSRPALKAPAEWPAGVDAETAAEIPPDVLAEALGQQGGRRSGRKTKARVVMIDGEPVLRSNNYSLNEGEPSVFDSELRNEDGDEEEPSHRTSYCFEPEKRKYNKSGKPRAPYKKRVKTDEENATGKHNREIATAIDDAKLKRSAYLSRHIAALSPFVDAKVVERIKSEADVFVPSEKILSPVDNQPASIKAVLREYQLEGIRWMTRMYDDGCSCILADEMGLGKTLQSIAFLATLHEMRNVKGPHLVICPLSVLSSWMDELQKWCPSFKVVRLHSTDETERQRLRKEVVMNVGSYDVAVTTYEMACNPTFNLTLSQKVYWRTMILDEGHKVKNEDTAAHSVLSRVHRQHTVLLTGTPVQNNLHELFAILAFLHPDVFSNSSAFDDAFDLSSNEHKVDSKTLDAAHYLMKPFVLRRVKGEVEVSLPEKTETKIMCPLSNAQTFWYRRLLQRENQVLTAVEQAEMRKHSGGGGRDQTNDKTNDKTNTGGDTTQNPGDSRKLQSLLMQLRKCCNHPYLFAGTDVPDEGVPVEELVEASGKLAVLDRILQKLKKDGHRVVLFSQFTSMLDILQDYLSLKGYGYARLDGSTNRVQRSVDIAAFNRPNSPLFAFLLSTRAGGLGVNLQTADTCILFDSDWNPQVDTQAMARVHRIGQTKPVHVYRLVTAGTVEERMQQRAEKKLFLEQMVSRGSTKQSEDLESVDKEDVYGLLKFGVDAIFANDEGKAPTDEELEILMDRTPNGNDRRAAMASLQSETRHTVADFAHGKASAAPISTYVMPAQIAGGDVEIGKKQISVKDIAAEFSSQILGKRERKTTTMIIDGHTVLKANNYSLEDGESSVFARETKAKKTEAKKTRAQVAGRDYGHSYTCQSCWDGGDIVCCDLCPVSVHAECVGMTQGEIAKAARWGCPHHACAECGRKSAAVGGMLFRCESCPRAFCEDHLPKDAEIIGECKRFQALGQRHPAQACFIRCDAECVKWAKEKRLEAGGEEGDEIDGGWRIGDKVALTDAWIEPRDHDLTLPCDPTGVRTKPLAHATFTDLVHFLLRVEAAPKRPGGAGGAGSAKAASAARRKKEGLLLEKPSGDDDDCDEMNDGGTETNDPVAQRLREEEEIAAAAAAAQRAGIAAAKTRVGNAGDAGADEFRDEPSVLGRGLKGLRQKDIDPTEREAIMTEMFKRARPFLERSITQAIEAEAEQLAVDRREDDEKRRNEFIRAERQSRRAEGIPVHLLSATASNFRQVSSSDDFKLGRAPTTHAEHGGEMTAGLMSDLCRKLIAVLKRSGAVAPDGAWLSASDVKVRLARFLDPGAVSKFRTRWDHPELGEAVGFVLVLCGLDRAKKIEMKRHDKYPSAVDLAQVRLAENVEVSGDDELITQNLSLKTGDGDEDVGASTRGVLPAALVRVQCGDVVGRLTPGGKRGEESVAYVPLEGGDEKVVPATEFERLGGRGSTRKWRQSLRHVDDTGDTVTTVGRFLKEKGSCWRDAIVGRAVEIQDNGDCEKFAAHEIVGFKPESGEHEVMSGDGTRDWLYLFLQTTRWPDGVPANQAPVVTQSTQNDAGGGDANKPNRSRQSGGGKSGSRGGRFDPAQMARPEAPAVTAASGPPGGTTVSQSGRKAYYTVDGETVYGASANLSIDFRDVLAWNRGVLPGLTKSTPLLADTGLWIGPPSSSGSSGSSATGPARKGDGGGFMETPGARFAAEIKEQVPQTAVRGAMPDLLAAEGLAKEKEKDGQTKETPEVSNVDVFATTETGAKRERDDDGPSEDAKEAGEDNDGDGDAPASKKRKKKPKPGSKPKAFEIPEEDVSGEVAATCVLRAALVPVFYGKSKGVFAPGSSVGQEMITVEVEVDAGVKRDAEMADAGDTKEITPETGAKSAAENAVTVTPSPATETISLSRFLSLAGADASCLKNWPSALLFAGDDSGGEGSPFGGWAKRKGAQWGKQCVGNRLEVLQTDSQRTLCVSKHAPQTQGSTCSWRPGEVVGYDPDTGTHEIAFADGTETTCFLFLQTMRWLLQQYDPVRCVPLVPPNGGIAIASPPIPVACGGMRGCLLPGGKRGEELVRYAAPRAAATPGVLAEFVVPATEFERLGGKGTAKKWRQSLRLVAPGTHRVAETMGKWFRTYGAQVRAFPTHHIPPP